MTIKVLELYSGIGGIHFALKNIKDLEFEVVAAFDINHLCNIVYQYNFENTKVFSKCLTSLNASDMDAFEADILTMSPPCQPFTSVGNQRDVDDFRTDSFKHILNVLTLLKKKPKYIFIENVAAFHKSQMRFQLISILGNLDYAYQEFLLNPLHFGIPNSRLRYYLMAKLLPIKSFSICQYQIYTHIPHNLDLKISQNSSYSIMKNILNTSLQEDNATGIETQILLEDYLENNIDCSPFIIPDKLLSKFWCMDIVNSKMKTSCCFTRRYGRYIEAAGSVLQMRQSTFDFDVCKNMPITEFLLEEIRLLKLRFFTPKEISNLLHFPQQFDWPKEISVLQKYRMLGSSVNVDIVSKLLKLLFSS